MRRKSLALLLSAILIVSLVVASMALAATKRVGVKQPNKWSTSSVSIRKGDTVRWSWSGSVPHNVTGSGFKSRTAPKLSYSRRFSRKGTFKVVCTVHRSTMKLTIRVR